jgi:hypothetical protein
MSMVRMIVGGVDTHADSHVAAVIDTNGGNSESSRSQLTMEGSRRCSGGSHPMVRFRSWVLRAPVRGVSVLPVSVACQDCWDSLKLGSDLKQNL